MSHVSSFAVDRLRITVWCCAIVTCITLAASNWTANALAQFAPTTPSFVATPPVAAPPAVALPEPIYWKQNLFLIPYQWSSAAESSAAQTVWLLVSKDHGATWQKVSEARAQVKAFNYHAEGDGEYWFAIRTIDRAGQPHPSGPYQPELRVVVDTTMPRIESVAAQLRSDGGLQLQWRASDPNLDPNSWRFEVQIDASDTWRPLPIAGLAITPLTPSNAISAPGVNDGQAVWQPPPGARPRALRATVYDRASNSAAFGTAITGAPIGAEPAVSPAGSASATPLQGWVSSSDLSSAALNPSGASAAQPWPTGVVASSPFRLSDGVVPTPGDQVTSYGNPPVVSTPLVLENSFANRESSKELPASPGFSPLEPHREAAVPFRQASLTRLPAVDGTPAAPVAAPRTDLTNVDATSVSQQSVSQLPPGVEPKHVGSRTFALEYELEDIGRNGIAKVELWGTRDGGQTWRSFATDDDRRSPLVVTVDGVGLYGFRIVVESAGGTPALQPRRGDNPELWIDVDLHRPTAELTSIQFGAGNLADRLILNWRAEDDNLEPLPIALFYSSRPAGPWTAIATSLANTGEYAWQLQRHLPDRVYLRLEARDTAGNLAAFQTREPVVLSEEQPSARIRGAVPLGTTATGADAGYR